MRLDPTTHTLVISTALMTSVAFAILVMNMIALLLQSIYG